VVCHNDMLAIGLMGRLTHRGAVVPRDISVVGFDDIFGADFCTPPLTTLGERTEEAGTRAVEALALQVNSRSTHTTTQLLPTQLVIRDSTGPVPG
jgi:LacI family transcriptional regulator